MAVIPGVRRGDLEQAPVGGTVSPYYHIAHLETALREQFREWFNGFTNEGDTEALAELTLAESDCGLFGAGGYYQRVLQCLCKGSRKLKSRVCTRSDRSGLVSLLFDLKHLEVVPSLRRAVLDYPTESALLLDDELKMKITTLVGEDLLRANLPFSGLKCAFRNHPYPKALRNLDPAVDLSSLVSIKGICLRLSSVIPEMQVAVFRCNGKASRNFQHITCNTLVSRPVVNGGVEEPLLCDQCQTHKNFVLDHDRCVFISKQLCKLQEHPDEVVEGEPPQMIFLFLYDNLVDFCKAGDVVSIVGVYKPLSAKVAARSSALKGLYRPAIDVMSMDRNTEDASVILQQNAALFTADFVSQAYALAGDPYCHQILLNSFAPEIWGLEDVKKGLLCQLFGGVSEYIHEAGKRLKSRGEIHILLCGDPAVAKSQLVRYVNKLSARSVYVVGSGTTSAGMTASIVRDPETKETVIESGAILLSDNGICCVDEFDKMDPTTRAVLHEVMEQQTISFAKAGIISSLNARTSILASANPIRSKYDRSKTIVENINLPNNLMTRFDLIFLCLDVANEQMDSKLSEHVCGLFSAPEVRAEAAQAKEQRQLDAKFFAKYVAYARASCTPQVGPEAQQELLAAYVDLRYAGGRNPIGNPRQLDSLVRLATALAKMQLKSDVMIEHVKEAARLIRVATYEALTDKNGRIDYDQLLTGKSTLQRQRQSLIANYLLQLLEEVKPEGLPTELMMRQTNEYLVMCLSGKVEDANLLGVSSQDKAILFAEISRADELAGVLELLQNTKKIGPLTNQMFTILT